MTKYAVSLTIIIEADTEQDAKDEFCVSVYYCARSDIHCIEYDDNPQIWNGGATCQDLVDIGLKP